MPLIHGPPLAPIPSMARALWKGYLAFGLANIPVELHTAIRESRLRFRILDARDHSPVRFEGVCLRDNTVVGWKDVAATAWPAGSRVPLKILQAHQERSSDPAQRRGLNRI